MEDYFCYECDVYLFSTYVGYMHYPVQQAIYVGLGKGVTKDDEDATEGLPQKFTTVTACIMFCRSKKEVETLFNGARY